MKKCFFLLFISFSTLGFSQNERIYTYQNETEFYFFDGNKVIFIDAIGYCFKDANSLSIRTYRKRIREFKRKLKFFKNGQITGTGVYKLFSDEKSSNEINYRTIQNSLTSHKDDLVDYLSEQGFYVLNFWQYIENPDAIDVQYYIGSQMNCIFYDFRIIKKRRSVELVKGDSGLIRIWE